MNQFPVSASQVARILVLGIVLNSGIGTTLAQSPVHHTEPADLLKNCPVGHRVQFEMSSTTIYIDIHSLGSSSIYDLFHWVSGPDCPTFPVQMKSVQLGGTILHELDIRSGLGRGLMRLYVGGLPSIAAWEPKFPNFDLNRSATEPWIEMPRRADNLTDYEKPILRNARAYLIHYPAHNGTAEQIYSVSCNGKEGNRMCSANYHVYSDLRAGARYLYTQTDLPIPEIVEPESARMASSDPTTEPGAILEFDVRLRAWIERMQQRP
ncbi:MAG TPA: hypothetical protein VN823_02980 [Stellaceae bacterium]|nr:hypothetical protein [Stellaceae bacterium]